MNFLISTYHYFMIIPHEINGEEIKNGAEQAFSANTKK
jgi:hypothetical protein